ncbi:hypothetical protein BT63DRAFT_429676 [Microthyrium microscopicum]|uniref:Zn(2)-C6 fungal-type domain-containing protein n=1 Tax=Microthyrium microscopicum TaxID=703497 RepID=A0A6A6TXG2_9PEZI|nr:hypothetical protein BT63DRAFT_429676 [Microthyrium microscopicum]
MDPQHESQSDNGKLLKSTTRKRKRRTLACDTCHQRKLKCDQGVPACGRCIKSKTSCSYSNGQDIQAEKSSHNSWTANDARSQIEAVSRLKFNKTKSSADSLSARSMTSVSNGIPIVGGQRPIDHVPRSNEQMVHSLHENSGSDPRRPETMLFKGKEFATQYFGATNPTSPLLQFPALRSFIGKEIRTAYKTYPHLSDDLKTLQDSIRKSNEKNVASPGLSVIDMLPNQQVAKLLSDLYFERVEIMYRILHGPKFWKDFDCFWESCSTPEQNDTFGVILILVVVITRVLAPTDQLQASEMNMVSLEPSSVVIESCEAWLSTQTRKHLTVELFQIRILIHMAKQVNCIQLKQTWTSAGCLLRFAMAAGLHRESSALGSKISPYNQEMRRRLWATVAEIDLQASLDRGMSSLLGNQQWDCNPPKNLSDDTYGDDSETIPHANSVHELSSTSFLSLSQQSVRLRSELCSILNDPMFNLSHDVVLEYDGRITALREELPLWDVQKGDAVRTMLEIQLQQYLLLVHFRFLQISTSRSKMSYSTFVCAETAISILQSFKSLQRLGFSIYSLLSVGGLLRPALTLCQIMFGSDSPGGHILAQCTVSAEKNIEDALSVIQENVMSTGRGFKEYWYVSAAYGFMQARAAPDEQTKNEREQQAWERVAALCYRVIAARKRSFKEKSTIMATHPLATTVESRSSDVKTTPSLSGHRQTAGSNEASTLPNVDGDRPLIFPGSQEEWLEASDFSQWTFDGFWDTYIFQPV